jgi:hypothetical protein
MDLHLGCDDLFIRHLAKLLLSWFCEGVYLEPVLNYPSAHPYEVGGFPRKNVIVLV